MAVKDLDTLKSLPYVASVIEHCGEIVYDYWKLKRNALGGKPLAPMTKVCHCLPSFVILTINHMYIAR